MELPDLAASSRLDASRFREYGQDAVARAIEATAEKMEAAFRAWWGEPLPVEEAAELGGVSPSTLYAAIREGRLTDAGPPGRKMLRRSDILSASWRSAPEADPGAPPREASETETATAPETDFADEVLARRRAMRPVG